MKKYLLLLCALALVFTQCKKKPLVEPTTPETPGNGTYLKVNVGFDEKTSMVENGTVAISWVDGDKLCVVKGGSCIGTLKYLETNNQFTGEVSGTLDVDDCLYLYYLGNVEVKDGATTATMDFSEQGTLSGLSGIGSFHAGMSEKVVLTDANVNNNEAITTTMKSMTSIAKFTFPVKSNAKSSYTNPIAVSGDCVYTELTVDFSDMTFKGNKTKKTAISIGTGESATKYFALIPSTDKETTLTFNGQPFVFNNGIKANKLYKKENGDALTVEMSEPGDASNGNTEYNTQDDLSGLQRAVNSVTSNADVVTLARNITLNEQVLTGGSGVTVSDAFTLNLNNDTISLGSGFSGNAVFTMNGSNNVTLSGDGVVTSGGKYVIGNASSKTDYGKFYIAGGTYDKEPGKTGFAPEGMDYEFGNVSDGFEIKGKTGTYYKVTDNRTAQIGDVKYQTLADAVSAVKNGETIVMLQDEVLENGQTIELTNNDAFTIDLNGKTISIKETGFDFRTNGTDVALTAGVPLRFAIVVKGDGTLNICDNSYNTSGQIKSANNGYGTVKTMLVYGNAVVNLNGGSILADYASVYVIGNTATSEITQYTPTFNIAGGKVSAAEYGVVVKGFTAALNLSAGTVESNGEAAIHTNGTQDWYDGGNSSITISGGTVKSTTGSAMYLAAETPTTITGGTFEGANGISVKGGTLNIIGDVVANATGAKVDPAAVSSGYTVTGSCIYVEDTYSGHTPVVNISAGTFSSQNNEAVQYYTNKESSASDKGYVVLTGGTYSTDPSAYVASGYKAEKDGNVWTVVESSGVCKIGDTKYETLAEAIAAVPTDGTQTTITMIANSTITDKNVGVEIAATKNVILDLNGKTITHVIPNSSDGATIRNKGTLTVRDSDVNGNGKITTSGTVDSNWLYGLYTIDNWKYITIESGTIEFNGNGVRGLSFALSSGSYGSSTTTVITGGTIVSTDYCAFRVYYQASGSHEVTINGGTIEGASSPIWYQICTDNPDIDMTINGGYITYNDNSNRPTATPIYIWAYDPGYNASKAKVNITGGYFKGGSQATALVDWDDSDSQFTNVNKAVVSGGFFSAIGDDEVKSGYEIVDNQDQDYPKKVQKSTAVCKINDTEYETLEEAFTAANTLGTAIIQMLADYQLAEGNAGVTVNAGNNITLDLNGMTVSNMVTESTFSQVITNYGTLTLTGNGIMTNALAQGVIPGDWPTYNYWTNIIVNSGTLIVENGTYNNTLDSGITYALDNVSNNGLYTVNATINGGTFISAGNSAVRMFCNSPTNDNNLTINGGYFEGNYYAVSMTQNKGKLTITDGEFESRATSWNACIANWNPGSANMTVNISGGKFNDYVLIGTNTHPNVTGGLFKYNSYTDPDDQSVYALNDYVADGYEVIGNSDPTTSASYPYTVHEKTVVSGTGTINIPSAGNFTGFSNLITVGEKEFYLKISGTSNNYSYYASDPSKPINVTVTETTSDDDNANMFLGPQDNRIYYILSIENLKDGDENDGGYSKGNPWLVTTTVCDEDTFKIFNSETLISDNFAAGYSPLPSGWSGYGFNIFKIPAR